MGQIESLPLFPLSDVVLLPELSVPLVVFEPRYRQMTRDVLRGSRQIGMVTVRTDSVTAMAGDPPIFDIGCLGKIAHAEERSDGTFRLLLLGESRFRILQEEQRQGERLYRSARVELLSDEVPQNTKAKALLDRRRLELLDCLERLTRLVDRTSPNDSAVEAFERLEPVRLINALTQSLELQAVERQRLLEADSIIGRFEIMGDLLCFRLAQVASGNPGSTALPN